MVCYSFCNRHIFVLKVYLQSNNLKLLIAVLYKIKINLFGIKIKICQNFIKGKKRKKYRKKRLYNLE